jgi:hypothetical protein
VKRNRVPKTASSETTGHAVKSGGTGRDSSAEQSTLHCHAYADGLVDVWTAASSRAPSSALGGHVFRVGCGLKQARKPDPGSSRLFSNAMPLRWRRICMRTGHDQASGSFDRVWRRDFASFAWLTGRGLRGRAAEMPLPVRNFDTSPRVTVESAADTPGRP